MLDDIFGQIWRKPAVLFPFEIMRHVSRIGDVDGVDAAALLLRDTLENPLVAGALHPHRKARIFRLEHLAEALGDLELARRVIGDLALFTRRLDQFRCDDRGRYRGFDRLGKDHARHRYRRCPQHLPARPLPFTPRLSPLRRTAVLVGYGGHVSEHSPPQHYRFGRRGTARKLSFRGVSETSEPGIHPTTHRSDKWIPGSPLSRRPGMTTDMTLDSAARYPRLICPSCQCAAGVSLVTSGKSLPLIRPARAPSR